MVARRRTVLRAGMGALVPGTAGCWHLSREGHAPTSTPTEDRTASYDTVSADSWPAGARDSANTGANTAASGPKEQPDVEQVFEEGTGNFNPPVVVNDTIFLTKSTDWATNFTVASLTDSNNRWTVEDVSGGVMGSPTVVGNRAFLGTSGGAVYAYDVAKRERRWRHEVDGVVNGGPAYADGRLYVASSEGNAYAIDASTGERVWRWVAPGMEMWRAQPAVDEGLVVYGAGKNVYALEAEDGEQRWRIDLDAEANVAPTISDGTVYVADTAGTLRAVTLDTGSIKWTFATGKAAATSATVAGETVVYATDAVYALDSTTGDVEWTVEASPNDHSFPATDGETLYVCSDASLLALDLSDGTERWRFETDLPIAVGPIVAGNTVYLPAGNTSPNDDGTPVVYRLSSQ